MIEALSGLMNHFPKTEGDSLQLWSKMPVFFSGKVGKNAVSSRIFGNSRGLHHKQPGATLYRECRNFRAKNGVRGRSCEGSKRPACNPAETSVGRKGNRRAMAVEPAVRNRVVSAGLRVLPDRITRDLPIGELHERGLAQPLQSAKLKL